MLQDQGDVNSVVEDRIRRILVGVEVSDFELVDPPADVWDRIEASIAAEAFTSSRSRRSHPKEPPSIDTPTDMVVEYWIDAHDVVSDVGQSWARFARDNDAPELANSPPDRTLWTYFDSEEVRELWQLLVGRVRSLHTAVQVPLRCDAPHAQRWFDLTITPEINGQVHFQCVLAFEEPRSPVALLELHSSRDESAPPIPVCSWCGRGQHGPLWLDIEELVDAARLLERAALPRISHGICGSCRDEMSADLLVANGTVESKP